MSVRSKVAELLALRDSVSESAVSIERFADEDAVREHVLRPAASTSTMGIRATASVPTFRARLETARSSSMGNNPTLLPPDANNSVPAHSIGYKRPSPTPSVKRNKVERLIKEHGSPPGLRVTAGGRVVPHDMPVLGSPQYPVNDAARLGDWNTSNIQGGSLQRSTSQSSYLRCASADVLSNSSVNTAMNTSIPAHQGYNPAFMQYYCSPAFQYSQGLPRGGYPGPPSAPGIPPNGRPHADVLELKKTLDKILVEQKLLERDLIVREGQLTSDERQRRIEQKVEMVNESDRIRKDIKRLESGFAGHPGNGGQLEAQKSAFPQPPGFGAPQAGPQPAMNPVFFANAPNFVPFAQGNQLQPPFLPPMPGYVPFVDPRFNNFDTAAVAPAGEPIPAVEDISNQANTDKQLGHGSRRSHALEIKDPRAAPQKMNGKRSVLDPTSPAYTPKKSKSVASQEDSSCLFVPPSPSPIASPERNATFAANFPWLCPDSKSTDDARSSPIQSARSSAHRPSASSINTADFFPNNPHEHSSTSYNAHKTQQASEITPEKPHWDNGPWISVFQSPEESRNSLRAPQVSPIDGAAAANGSALVLHQGSEDPSGQTGQLCIPHNVSRDNSDGRVSASAHAVTFKREVSREPTPSLNGQLDYKNKSFSFLMGFSAGLSRQTIQGTEDVDFMQGWTQGLLQAKKSHSRSPSEDSHKSLEKEAYQPVVGYLQPVGTPVRKISTSTLKAAPPGQEQRPMAARFTSSDTSRSITSAMGIGPASAPVEMRSVSGETDKTIRDKIDSMFKPAPMTQYSGNEKDREERKTADRSDHSPSKFTRVFSGQQNQGQHKSMRSFTFNCLGDQRDPRSINRSYDGTGEEDLQELDADTFAPSSNPGSSAQRASPHKASPSKASERRDFTDSPSMSTGSPKKSFKNSPAMTKLEEMAGKSKKGRKSKKADNEEGDEPATMNREDKKNWKEGWKRRFQDIKNKEAERMERYQQENPLPE